MPLPTKPAEQHRLAPQSVSSLAPPTANTFSDDKTLSASHPLERRREPRFPTNDPVEVCILEPRCERVGGTILDISRSGLRVEVRTPVARTVHLQIILRNRAIIFGETRYCRCQSGVYQIGVSIDDVYFAQALYSRHVDADLLNRYMVGKGLTVLEVIQIRIHLANCATCREQFMKQTASPAGR
jgi:PilZ domain